MIDKDKRLRALSEMLPMLQVSLIEAHLTQCTTLWRDLDYTPDYHKLYYICEGEGWLQVAGTEYRPLPGQLFLMPAHVLQSYEVVKDRPPYLKYWCHFHAELGPSDLFSWLEVPLCLDVAPADQPGVKARFESLIACARDAGLSARFREKAHLLELLAPIVERATMTGSGRHSDEADRIVRIKQFVESHLQNPVTLDELAAHIHLHPNYLIRYFNKHFGVSPLKYMNRKRMEKAKQLLRTTSLSIKEVAAATGFEDTNHFAKVFRRETSFSPTSYRADAN